MRSGFSGLGGGREGGAMINGRDLVLAPTEKEERGKERERSWFPQRGCPNTDKEKDKINLPGKIFFPIKILLQFLCLLKSNLGF